MTSFNEVNYGFYGKESRICKVDEGEIMEEREYRFRPNEGK